MTVLGLILLLLAVAALATIAAAVVVRRRPPEVSYICPECLHLTDSYRDALRHAYAVHRAR